MLRRFVTKNSKVLAIGDGLNDFMMLKEADVSVGILSNEILQVRNTCDIIVTRFSQIVDLILVHGTWNIKRLNSICFFSIYCNTFIMFGLFLRQNDNMLGATLYDNLLLKVLDLLVFNLMSVFIFCFDQNVERPLIGMNPNVYKGNYESNSAHSFIKRIVTGIVDSLLTAGVITYCNAYAINSEGQYVTYHDFNQLINYTTYLTIFLKVILLEIINLIY